jgi:hypothetical protein
MARRDYFYDPEAPKPNSIRPATAVALFNSAGAFLCRSSDAAWRNSSVLILEDQVYGVIRRK